MNLKLIFNCGEAVDKLDKLDMDQEFLGTGADSAQQTKAFAILQDLVNDPEFATDGRRNKDAVNFSIALWVLGYDPIPWFEALDDTVNFHSRDYREFTDHLRRVHDYLSTWGPQGNEGQALDKLI